MRCLFVLCAGLLISCAAPRQALSPSQVRSAADDRVRAEAWGWAGKPVLLAPDLPDARGLAWWQVQYPSGEDGAQRLVLVDAYSGWVKLPPADYRPLAPLWPAPAALRQTSRPLRGWWLLVVDGQNLDLDIAQLNAQAEAEDRWPLFVSRPLDAGGQELVYGWQGDCGIPKDDTLSEWMLRRLKVAGVTWVQLGSGLPAP